MESEDTWTKPSIWCPAPRWWHSETADATEMEVTRLVAGLVMALQPSLVVETGTNTGQTAEAIGLALMTNGHGHLDTIEFDPELHLQAKERCIGLPVNCICGSSLEYAPPSAIGFAWFDSAIDIRAKEINRMYAHFAPGAIIGVHDTGPQHPVFDTLRPLIVSGMITALNLRTPRGVVIAQVHT